MIGRVAVVNVVVVRVDRVDIASFVDAHIDKLMPVTNRSVRVVVYHVVGEGFATISGNCHVNNVGAAWAGHGYCTSTHVTTVDATEGLVDVVVVWINHQIPDRVATHCIEEEEMVAI